MTLARTQRRVRANTLADEPSTPPAGTDALFWNGSADHASTDELDQRLWSMLLTWSPGQVCALPQHGGEGDEPTGA